MKSFFGNRPTSEILILVITFTVVGYIILTGVLVVVLIFTDKDASAVARNLADIVNTLIGLLAGYLAGRSGLGKKNGNGTSVNPSNDSEA